METKTGVLYVQAAHSQSQTADVNVVWSHY